MNQKDQPSSTTEISLVSLGKALRQQREAQELGLQDCAERLKIRHRYLDALEQGQPDNLPGDVFYINFTKSYATTLGLDGDSFASKTRQALQAQGRMKELRSVLQYRYSSKVLSTQDSSKHTPAQQKNTEILPPPLTNLTTEGASFNKSPLSSAAASSAAAPSSADSAFLSHSSGGFPSQRITDIATEKQLLRETLLSPLFVVGALLAIVLLYLGTVIVIDLLDREDVVSSTKVTAAKIDEKKAEEEQSVVEAVEDVRLPRIYGAAGSPRVELLAKETCWIAVFATDSSLGKRAQTELLFADTLLEGDRYRVPAELGIMLKSGNLSCLSFAVQGITLDPFRTLNPSGFMSLEPSHLRTQTAVREGGVLARERLPVVLEIELLRQQRAEQASKLEGENP